MPIAQAKRIEPNSDEVVIDNPEAASRIVLMKYPVKPERSLAEELITERRAEAENE